MSILHENIFVNQENQTFCPKNIKHIMNLKKPKKLKNNI